MPVFWRLANNATTTTTEITTTSTTTITTITDMEHPLGWGTIGCLAPDCTKTVNYSNNYEH
jgi:hypothetical protein